VTLIYAFNGDADGLCALQQLRTAQPAPAGAAVTLVTGVKRDIALLARVQAQTGDVCTVLDVSLDVNRAGLMAVLDAGAAVRYFDHHFTGDIPEHPRLELHIDLSPSVCTSILVDRTLAGRARAWAAVGAFGDSLVDEGRALAAQAGVAADAVEQLNLLGTAINYNAYGETIADLHVPPAQLADEMLPFADPLAFVRGSATCRRLFDGFRDDMERARQLKPERQVDGALLFMLPDAAWARRVSGTLANDLGKAHAGCAVAIVSPKSDGGYLVSLRVPRESSLSAEGFCRKFPTGGGRRTAAGINHLPSDDLASFASAFEQQFRAR
jgi:hypothetical protein